MIVVETVMGEDLELGVGDTSKTHQSGGTLLGTKVSLTTFSVAGVNGYASTATWDPGEIAVNAQVTTTIAVPGAALGDMVMVSHDGMLDNALMLTGHVKSAGQVRVVMRNGTADPVTPTGTLKVLVFKVR